MKKIILLILLILSTFSMAQIIVDPEGESESTLPLDELIQEVLFSGCEDISNLVVKSGDPENIKSYGYFVKGSSDFDFSNGIVLSTGKVSSVPAPFTTLSKLGEGDEVRSDWTGDLDLQKILDKELGGTQVTYNSTFLEFDIIPLTETISIDFIFGSNEYELPENFECINTQPGVVNFQDGFGFLIQGPNITNDSGFDFKNIALIPGTTEVVGVGTIHNNTSCDNVGRADLYREGQSNDAIDVNGYTVPLTAVQNVTPGETYHIKIVLGERGDGRRDSFLFLKGDGFSFNIDLGEDKTICRGDSYTLDAGNLGGLATYKWFLNNSEISGATNSTLEVSESGMYKVEATLSDCVLSDEVIVEVEELPAPRKVISIQCSENEFAEFNLPSKNEDIIDSPESYTITYYKEFIEASENRNPLPNNYTNEIPDNQEIWVRVESENNCISFSQYMLMVSPIPIFNGELVIEQCDENQNGLEFFDLQPLADQIIANSIATMVTFHLTLSEAQNMQNPLPNIFESGTRTIYARYESGGCGNTEKVNLTVLSGPEIKPITEAFCDTENDGEIIDLTKYESQLDALLTYEYYKTEENTIAQTNAISNPNSVTVTDETTLFYVRTVSLDGSCESYTTITIVLESLPILNETEITYDVCDSELDSEVSVKLEDVKDVIDSTKQYRIEFYLTMEDGENDINEIITSNYTVTEVKNQLIAKVYSGEKCYSYVTVYFEIVDIPQLLTDSVNIEFCQENGTVLYDLNLLESQFIADASNVVISYHSTVSDAENNVNPIENNTTYNIINQGEKVYIRIQSFAECASIGTINFELIKGPTNKDRTESFCIKTGTTLEIDLTEYEVDIDSTNQVKYYETLDNAEIEQNELDNVSNYILSTSQNIYQRVNLASGLSCYTINTIELNVSDLPEVQNTALEECEFDGDGVSNFILTTANESIVINSAAYTITYFSTESDLESNTNKLPDLYTSKGNETVYVKIEDPNTTCFSIAEIQLIVSASTSNGTVEQIGCESDSDGFTSFNLSENNTEITQIISGTTVQYFASLSDADLQQNELPNQYTNTTVNRQTIYAKVTDGNTCMGLVEVDLKVIQNPTLIIENSFLKCAEDEIILDAGAGHSSYMWSTGEVTQQITVNESGDYIITVFNEEGCNTSKTVTVENYSDAILVDVITGTDFIEIVVKNSNQYTFSIDGVNFQKDPRFRGLPSGIYTLFAKNMQGCITTLDSVGFITQDTIANVITPNGDGFNDSWIVEGLDAFSEATVQVFTREGKEVLNRIVGSGFSWDGKYLGRKLPSNDYWYIIKLPDGKVFKSHLTIKNR